MQTANTARVFMTVNFKSEFGCVTALALSLYSKVVQNVPLIDSILHALLIAVISHITKLHV